MALNIRIDYGNMIRLNVHPVFILKVYQTPVAMKYTLTINNVQSVQKVRHMKMMGVDFNVLSFQASLSKCHEFDHLSSV